MKAKTIHSSIITLLLLATVSCKNQNSKDLAMVEETAEIEIPNISDAHFEMALKQLNKDNKQKAAEELDKGKQGLIDESGNVQLTLKGKDQLDNAVFSLDQMINALKNGNNVNIDKVKQAILKGELATKHSYLVTENVYMLTSDKSKEMNETFNELNNNMEALKAFNKDLKADHKETANKLYEEGKTLEKEYTDWLQKVKVHNAKSSDFLESEIFEGNLPLNITE